LPRLAKATSLGFPAYQAAPGIRHGDPGVGKSKKIKTKKTK
jgi:hypothetical protein